MSTAASLRALFPDDRGPIERIVRAAGNFNEGEIGIAMELVDIALTRPGQKDYRFVVSDDGGRVTGYACWGLAGLSDGTWDLYWVVVDKTLQGKGIGKKLVEHCEKDVKAERGRSLLIETSSRAGYDGTFAFYRGLNYDVLGRIRDYYATGDDKVILGKYFSYQE